MGVSSQLDSEVGNRAGGVMTLISHSIKLSFLSLFIITLQCQQIDAHNIPMTLPLSLIWKNLNNQFLKKT